ncbi:4453_t:CDS:2, partial [Cetraspora pellucida]
MSENLDPNYEREFEIPPIDISNSNMLDDVVSNLKLKNNDQSTDLNKIVTTIDVISINSQNFNENNTVNSPDIIENNTVNSPEIIENNTVNSPDFIDNDNVSLTAMSNSVTFQERKKTSTTRTSDESLAIQLEETSGNLINAQSDEIDNDSQNDEIDISFQNDESDIDSQNDESDIDSQIYDSDIDFQNDDDISIVSGQGDINTRPDQFNQEPPKTFMQNLSIKRIFARKKKKNKLNSLEKNDDDDDNNLGATSYSFIDDPSAEQARNAKKSMVFVIGNFKELGDERYGIVKLKRHLKNPIHWYSDPINIPLINLDGRSFHYRYFIYNGSIKGGLTKKLFGQLSIKGSSSNEEIIPDRRFDKKNWSHDFRKHEFTFRENHFDVWANSVECEYHLRFKDIQKYYPYVSFIYESITETNLKAKIIEYLDINKKHAVVLEFDVIENFVFKHFNISNFVKQN